MITKVTYRPYASGVNSTQTRPQKVNFCAENSPQVTNVAEGFTSDILSEAARFRIKLLELALSGQSRDTTIVEASLVKVFDFLEKSKVPIKQLVRASKLLQPKI